MLPLTKEDVQILDTLLKVITEMMHPYYEEFNKERIKYPILEKLEDADLFYFFDILTEKELVTYQTTKDSFFLYETNLTKGFLKRGGFNKVFESQILLEQKEKLEIDNLKLNNTNLKLSIFQLKYSLLFIILNVALSILVGYIINYLTKS